MTESRTRKSMRNVAVGLGAQVVLLALGIVCRAVFIHTLNIEFVGIDSLFLSILGILTLADAGLGAAVMYAMYQPLRDGDTARLASLVSFTRTMYRYVAAIVFVGGLAIIPFLDHMANTDGAVRYLEVYYVILLASVAGSYLFSYRMPLLVADQRVYLTSAWGLGFQGSRSALQIVALLAFESYLPFVTLQAVATVSNAAFVRWRCGTIYPYLRDAAEPLPGPARKSLLDSLKALVIYRVSGVVLNNTAPILVVTVLGAAVGGRYANYMLIVGTAILLLDIVFTSLTASIGHLAVEGSPDRSRAVFDELGLVAAVLYGVVSVGLLTMLDDLVSIWVGSKYTLDETVLLAIVINFLVYGLMAPVMAFRQATGLFRDAKYALALTAILNILLSIVLGHIIGLAGIVVATPIARLLANYWIEPWLLVRKHIGGGFASYLLRQAEFVGLVALSVVVVGAIDPGSVGPVPLRLLAEGVTSVVVTGAIMGLAMGRTVAFKMLRYRVTGREPS